MNPQHPFFKSLLPMSIVFALLASSMSAMAQNPASAAKKRNMTQQQALKGAEQKQAQQKLIAQGKALFKAQKMKSGTIVVLAKDYKGAQRKGKKISGADGFNKIGKRKLKSDDLKNTRRVTVFQKSPGGAILAYHANSIDLTGTALTQANTKGKGKGKGKDKGKGKGNGQNDTNDDEVDQAAAPSGAVEQTEFEEVSEPIVIEPEETVVAFDTIDVGDGTSGDGPCATFGYCPENKPADSEPEVVIIDNDVVITEIEVEDSESLLGYSKKQPTRDWHEIPVVGQGGCGSSGGDDSSFAVINRTEGECVEELEYREAYQVGSTSCPKSYPKNDDYNASFRHGLSLNCYSCPTGYERSLNPDIKANNACVKTQKATTSKEKAEKIGPVYVNKPHKKAFKDLDKWWRCPDNRPRRTAYKVTDKKACATEKVIGEKLASAIDLGPIKNKKPSGAFQDPRNGGEYWKCPTGFDRSASAVTASDACVKTVAAKTLKKKAALRGDALVKCDAGSFLNTQSGHCYKCPVGFRQSASVSKNSAKDPKACVEAE